MEGFGGGSAFDLAAANSVRKKRSNTSRRPRPDSHTFRDTFDVSPPSSTPPASENVSKVSSDENNGYGNSSSRRKEFNLNQSVPRVPSVNNVEGENSGRKIRKDDGTRRGFDERGRGGSEFKRSSEGALAPANWKSTSKASEGFEARSKKQDSHLGSRKNGESVVSDRSGKEDMPRKVVKLKLGGVTRTIHAKSTSDAGGSSGKSSRLSDVSRPRPKLILQENSDDEPSSPSKGSGLQGVPWKDFSKGGSNVVKKEDSLNSRAKLSEDRASGKQTDKFEPTRKSKRVPKPKVLDGAFSDEDDEIRYLEKMKTPTFSTDHGMGDEIDDYGSKKQRRLSSVSKSRFNEGGYDEDSSRSSKDSKRKSRPEKTIEDTDYMGEEEPTSDMESEIQKKKQKKESIDTLMEGKKETTLTTRQRAMQSGKDTTAGSNGSLIEFPDGLPPAPSRKQKDKLTEVEQQLKKAEAAQRRRMQVEKAARESEAEAIRKILGQDSSRKKREDKMKKRRDEIAQEKAANSITLPPNTIRWVFGPSGTVVTFPPEMGLPSIFGSENCSYPPPREKCARRSCTNAYRYRDSKSKLPLCSLQCYKAVNDPMQPVSTC